MIDFFDSKYLTESARTDSQFGICDNGRLAYTTPQGDPAKWIAVVSNEDQRTLQFVPVDHNIVVYNAKGEEISQCDGMLYAEGNLWLAFVVLKEVRTGWKKKPYEQLESTIQLFLANHNYRLFSKRFAYAVNRKHPHFAHSKKDEMQTFYNRYKFRLLFQRNIVVK